MYHDFHLKRLPLSWKLLVTGFLFLLGSGYLAAAANAFLSVGVSPQAVAEHYGGPRLAPEEEQTLEDQGFVEEEFSLDEEDTDAPDHDMAMGEGMDHDGGETADDTLPPQVLAQVSHVHLLGFSWILLSVGTLACLTRWRESTKAVVVVALTLSLAGDIAGLNLTRFASPGFAWLTVVSASLVGVLLLLVTLRVLWELWLAKDSGGTRP